MTSIAGGLNTGIWLCAVVLGATGSAIIVTVAASLLCAGVKCIVKHFKNGADAGKGGYLWPGADATLIKSEKFTLSAALWAW